eukprot:600202-Hanusia_phi.AAC.1
MAWPTVQSWQWFDPPGRGLIQGITHRRLKIKQPLSCETVLRGCDRRTSEIMCRIVGQWSRCNWRHDLLTVAQARLNKAAVLYTKGFIECFEDAACK